MAGDPADAAAAPAMPLAVAARSDARVAAVMQHVSARE